RLRRVLTESARPLKSYFSKNVAVCQDRLRLILPEIFKSAACQFRISHRVLNVLVAEIKLDRARILSSIRQIKARRMSQHMRVYRKFDSGRLCGLSDNAMNGAPRRRTAAQRREYIWRRVALISLPCAQGSEFGPSQRMRRWRAVLQSCDVQRTSLQI